MPPRLRLSYRDERRAARGRASERRLATGEVLKLNAGRVPLVVDNAPERPDGVRWQARCATFDNCQVGNVWQPASRYGVDAVNGPRSCETTNEGGEKRLSP